MTPALASIDHVHVYVTDRPLAQSWYARVLGLRPLTEFSAWTADGGPLTVGDAAGRVHLALFERPAPPCRSTIAFAVPGGEFLKWKEHLELALPGRVTLEDHELSWSFYFRDPDGNPFEITTYDHAQVAPTLRASVA